MGSQEVDGTTAAHASGTDERDELLAILLKALRRLGQAGQPEDANRLAASAWSLLRHDHPADAERVNGTMHYLARLEAASSADNTRMRRSR